tara:strand:- start:14060 stop:15121 length:1062 start_codon:yes stop_codon:yes gene_type:complete
MILCWAIEFDNLGGEGILARTFIKNLASVTDKKIFIVTPNKVFLIKKSRIICLKRKKRKDISMQKSKNLFKQRFVYPLEGVSILFRNKKFKKKIYLNYLPLWQFPLFLLSKLLKFDLGPIVGGVFYRNKYKSLLNILARVYIMKFFYFLSAFVIKTFNIEIVSANSAINNFLEKQKIFSVVSPINLLAVDNYHDSVESKKRDIDVIFYYRRHDSKYPILTMNLASSLSKKGKNVFIFGEKFEANYLNQVGYVSKDRLLDIFSKSKIFINLADNPENLTVYDAISRNCSVVNIFDVPYKSELIHTCKDIDEIEDFVLDLLKNNDFSSQKSLKLFQEKRMQVSKDLQEFLRKKYS